MAPSSRTLMPRSMAIVAARTTSPALEATTVAPSSRPVPASATSLARPRVSPLTSARGTASIGSTRVSTSSPASRATASVSPAAAMLGSVKMIRGSELKSSRPPPSPNAFSAAAAPPAAAT